MQAAASIGDDTLMRRAGRRPVEEAFTHGSAQQRMEALKLGLSTGNEERCEAYFQ